MREPAYHPTGSHRLFLISRFPIFLRHFGITLLLHGFTSSGAEFDRLVPILSTERSLIRPDLLGYGNSQRLEE